MKLEIAVLAFRLLWTPNQEPDFSHYIVYSGENPASFSAFQNNKGKATMKMNLYLYPCPEISDVVEIQVHDENHKIIGAAVCRKGKLTQLLRESQPIDIKLDTWAEVEKIIAKGKP